MNRQDAPQRTSLWHVACQPPADSTQLTDNECASNVSPSPQLRIFVTLCRNPTRHRGLFVALTHPDTAMQATLLEHRDSIRGSPQLREERSNLRFWISEPAKGIARGENSRMIHSGPSRRDPHPRPVCGTIACRGSLQLQSRSKKRSLAFNRLGSKGKAFSIKSNEIETIEIHHLVPRRHKIFYEPLFRIVACIDFGYGP